jgi:3-oxoacyl-[acyl-carrier protein] reductase
MGDGPSQAPPREEPPLGLPALHAVDGQRLREELMDLELRGRGAVVTGCSVGIGREIARVLAAEGVATLVIARRAELLKTLQDEVESAGGVRPHALAIDLTNRTAAIRVRDEALARLGHVDILVNNAGGSRPTAVDADDAVWDESFAINFDAVRKLTQVLVPGMITRRWGRILNVTGTSEPAGTNAAGPAKAAVHAWSKGLSRDLGKHGITVNCLAPGRIHSEQIDQRLHPTPESQAKFSKQIPLGYFGDPCDMAYLVAFLCSPKARYITGERIHVDGGLRRAY